MNGFQRVVAMLEGRPVDCLPLMPITMMFAGDLAGVPYGKYAADHRLMVRSQLAVAERFGFDYVSCISDPAREASDCGACVQWFNDQPPAIDETRALLADKQTLRGLSVPDPTAGGRMLDRVQAAALFRQQVGGQLAIEGWVEGPCAESADLRGINALMLDFYDDPAFVRDLFDFVLEMALRVAKAQVDAGVALIGVGDAAASLVGPQIYEEFVWPYEKKLVDALHAMGTRVRLHICGNTNRIVKRIGELGCEMVDIDYMVPMSKAREAMGTKQVLAGNLNPVAVLRAGAPESVTAAVAECHAQSGAAYIVAAGCEIPRDTAHGNVMALTEYARSHGA
jgi:MtaA/CmuA family methyltransferase